MSFQLWSLNNVDCNCYAFNWLCTESKALKRGYGYWGKAFYEATVLIFFEESPYDGPILSQINLSNINDCLNPTGVTNFDMYDFAGEHCEQNIDDCADQCGVTNGTGQCVDDVDGYHCVCEPGYTGADCEVLLRVSCCKKSLDILDMGCASILPSFCYQFRLHSLEQIDILY